MRTAFLESIIQRDNTLHGGLHFGQFGNGVPIVLVSLNPACPGCGPSVERRYISQANRRQSTDELIVGPGKQRTNLGILLTQSTGRVGPGMAGQALGTIRIVDECASVCRVEFGTQQ